MISTIISFADLTFATTFMTHTFVFQLSIVLRLCGPSRCSVCAILPLCMCGCVPYIFEYTWECACCTWVCFFMSYVYVWMLCGVWSTVWGIQQLMDCFSHQRRDSLYVWTIVGIRRWWLPRVIIYLVFVCVSLHKQKWERLFVVWLKFVVCLEITMCRSVIRAISRVSSSNRI